MKKLLVIFVSIIVIILAATVGYFYKGSIKQSSFVLPDGNYSVDATWEWKSLTVNKDKYILDNTRNYDVIAQNNENGIIVINTANDSKIKKTQVYKIIKSGNKYKCYTVNNGMVSKKVAATATKK
ncbi:hypothetical protein [Pseudolactococcus carnosus]|uniref:hypothetical protein n=1 Tax=Pseudolactococcus carnosus TaxID=2749961 RepID=UPI001FBB1D91|nr:hypothetical protein [Lactococcus carnosus]MCJ1970980.1 hypothetical protein [Lactococcus carnosus]MCJ1980428.1 hypothetical protein [Lactococcus carnosus]MCJ2000491.1 hypothetical protein [Lactococcus carnosus]